MTKELFVGIDSAKDSHYVSLLNPTRVKKDLEIKNTREGFKLLTDKLDTYRNEDYQVTVACESTGHYWENLGRYLKSRNFNVKLVNPFHTSRYKEIVDNSPEKDDKKDSQIIAQLLKEGYTLHENLPQAPYGELRELTHLREDLLEGRSRVRNRLHKWLDRHFLRIP